MLTRASALAIGGLLLFATTASPTVHAPQHRIVYGPTVHMCRHSQGNCSVGNSTAHCPQGWIETGGGYVSPNPSLSLDVVVDAPANGGWGVVAGNNGNLAASFRPVVVCET